ncbi:MAG: hypothetical protein Q4D30_03495 [Bacteroidales bacterium]|nr:hypothetical protein [Bacteroidales bacterium]
MKKKIFAAVFAMAAVFGGYQNYASASSVALSDIVKANVEALSVNSVNELGTLYGTQPDELDQVKFCCGPGDRQCGAAPCYIIIMD